jgi:hypothetical protein
MAARCPPLRPTGRSVDVLTTSGTRRFVLHDMRIPTLPRSEGDTLGQRIDRPSAQRVVWDELSDCPIAPKTLAAECSFATRPPVRMWCSVLIFRRDTFA